MPLCLIFTSAAQGLTPGRSGFCTVARHADMPERLAALLEGLGTPHATPGSATFTLRRLEAGGRGWNVLSRFTAGGLDYTQRDNRLAHHLVFTDSESATLPPPADVALRWKGWVDQWSQPACWLEPTHLQLAPGRPLIPCSAWRRLTGTGAKAAWLVSGDNPVNVSLVHANDTATLLELLAESGALLGRASWGASFTTDASVTGAEGFAWCGGEAGSRRRIDVATAGNESAPEGEKAQLAALGVATRKTISPVPLTTPIEATSTTATTSLWPVVAVLSIVALAAGYLLLRQREPAPPPVVTTTRQPRPPTADEMAAAASLLRANDALRELQDVIARGDLVTAAKEWSEISRLSPEFTARHRDQFVPRIQAGIALAAADSLDRQLSTPGAVEDRTVIERLLVESAEAIRTGTEIGAPRDAAWQRLLEMDARVRLLAQLDIRETWLVAGQWVTATAGPNIPSTADFDLGKEAGEFINRFLREGLTGGAGTSTPVTVRLCALPSLGHRDTATRAVRATLQPGASSLWLVEDTTAGRRPTITLSVGSRANVVSLNLPGSSASGFAQRNHAIEITNPAGRRLCIGLLAQPGSFAAIAPGLGGLSVDTTLSTGPAAWIDPLFRRVHMSGGRIGLFPADHEFPERVATLSVSRNVIDTDLIRLNSGSSGVTRAIVADRRRHLDTGDTAKAGAPWSIRFVDARGNPLITLADFR